MAARATAPFKKSKTQTQTVPLEEQIRVRAYEIYLERGGQGETELEDWLQAERELRPEAAQENVK